jgi:FAD/FMN-containing dehydrogenase
MTKEKMEIKEKLLSVLPKSALGEAEDNQDLYALDNPALKNGNKPVLTASPGSPEELVDLVKKANEEKIGLVPVSSGAPHEKGGLSCKEPHVIVDLTNWKMIDRPDRRNRVVTIEPGVTYGELLTELEQHGMTLSMPLAPRSKKSVLAAVMDREPSTWPNRQWDHSDPLGSTEFIFGTGDVFRTGAAGGPGSLEQQRKSGGAQKSPMGPSQTDFQRVVQGSQGSMGITTWVTLRTEIKPTVEKPMLLSADDVEKLFPFIYEVQRPWTGEHTFILDKNAAAALMTYDEESKFGSVRDSLPAYICLQNIAGFNRLPQKRVDYQFADISDIANMAGLKMEESIGEVSAKELLARATKTCGGKDWRHLVKGHCLKVFFMSTLDKSPVFINAMKEVCKKHDVDENTLGIYLQPVVQNHSCHIEFMVFYSPDSPSEVEKMKALEAESVKELMEKGAFFNRPYGTAQDAVFSKNEINYETLKKIKNIFDPNRVLNPGKFGL